MNESMTPVTAIGGGGGFYRASEPPAFADVRTYGRLFKGLIADPKPFWKLTKALAKVKTEDGYWLPIPTASSLFMGASSLVLVDDPEALERFPSSAPQAPQYFCSHDAARVWLAAGC